jgi:hypothetical protein
MNEIKVSKKLDRFTACFAFVFNADFNSMRGITDNFNKMLCIYAARRTFGMGDGILSTYYRINVGYMQKQMEHVAMQLLINDELAERLGNVRLYWELESSKE